MEGKHCVCGTPPISTYGGRPAIRAPINARFLFWYTRAPPVVLPRSRTYFAFSYVVKILSSRELANVYVCFGYHDRGIPHPELEVFCGDVVGGQHLCWASTGIYSPVAMVFTFLFNTKVQGGNISSLSERLVRELSIVRA